MCRKCARRKSNISRHIPVNGLIDQRHLKSRLIRFLKNVARENMSGIIRDCSMKKETKKRKRAESKRRKTMISERLKKESFELFAKLQKLAVFIGSERYKKLSLFHRYLLRRQFHFMRRYLCKRCAYGDFQADEHQGS